jgi:hypothetical protein
LDFFAVFLAVFFFLADFFDDFLLAFLDPDFLRCFFALCSLGN